MSRLEYVTQGDLFIDRRLNDFIEQEALPDTGITPQHFWDGLGRIIERFAPRNRQLLLRRRELQHQIDEWHLNHPFDPAAYRRFLETIGYLVPEGEDFEITTENVDPEIARIAAPQLVVPVDNARYALNAANARWGSLYDAIYGSDMLPELPASGDGRIDQRRARAVIGHVRDFLDRHIPLDGASHRDVTRWTVIGGRIDTELADG